MAGELQSDGGVDGEGVLAGKEAAPVPLRPPWTAAGAYRRGGQYRLER
ncbi:hypothetical protein SEHO0A_02586 [Salmonella enterica subsp. houtenae str. ATCC BAA-1581]|nr:hypothetical protein SEHO0A_02586 [Salmonella enterica subsp. houtenae str. ATCC BAA-1581]